MPRWLPRLPTNEGPAEVSAEIRRDLLRRISETRVSDPHKKEVLSMTSVSHGKPYAGDPHVWFEEGGSASEEPRRKTLHHRIAMSLCCVLMLLYQNSFSMSLDGGVNYTNTPLLCVTEAIERLERSDLWDSRTQVVLGALSYKSDTNEWWLITAGVRLEESDARVQYYFVNNQGVRSNPMTCSKCKVPSDGWKSVISAVEAAGLSVSEVVALSRDSVSAEWSISLTTGEIYDYDRKRMRLTKSNSLVISGRDLKSLHRVFKK